MIKSAEADNLSVTVSVNGLSPGFRICQTASSSSRTESNRCSISKVPDVLTENYFEISEYVKSHR